MRNLITAVFLIFIFCAVSASGKDPAKESDQDFSFESAASSVVDATKKMFGEVKNFFGFDEPAKAKRTSNRSFRDTLWEEKLKEWEKRQSPVPQSLPRATFQLHKQSSSRSFRSSHRSFRSSHRPKITHVRRGRSHVRIRSR